MVDNTELDDGIIELTQLVEEDSSAGSDQEVIVLTDIQAQPEEIEETGLELDLDDGKPPTDDILLLEESEVASDPEGSFAIESITPEQVEAALERVIEKKFAAIIEKSLVDVMEKVVEREIADIRKRLQADLDKMAIS
jgi:hypothetical protein